MAHTGLLIAVTVLIIMSLFCHVSNFMFPKKSEFQNVPNYNAIHYDYPNVPCKEISKSQAEIPCEAYNRCKMMENGPIPTKAAEGLSESEIAMLYRLAYEEAGEEIMRRSIETN